MKRKFPVWLSVAIALVFFGDISRTPNPSPSGAISLETPAASARSSGGRSRGGSFRRNSSPSTSSGSSPQGTSSSSNSSHSPSQRSTSGSSLRGGSFQESSPTPNRSSSTSESDSRQNPPNSQTSPQRTPSPNRSTTPTSPLPSSPSQNHSPTQTVPNRDRAIDEAETRSQSPNTHTSRTGSWIFLAVGGGLFAVVFWAIGRGFLVSLTSNSENTDGESGPSELENEVVTVSKLQIALLAIARDVQQELTEASSKADLETREGLANFLQQSALTLLQASEYWRYARSESQTFPNRSAAARFFEELSIAERSNFSQETFRHEGGEIETKEVQPDAEEGPSAYIVVTLLIGTEDDQPLFDTVYSPEDLETALKKVAATTPEYLLVFELLWCPQDASDSLTYEELLTEYTDMLQIA